MNKDYPHQLGLSYTYKGKKNQFTILTKEDVSRHDVNQLIFVDYDNYINTRKSKKVSENNIVKFLNENGIDCVNRKYYK